MTVSNITTNLRSYDKLKWHRDIVRTSHTWLALTMEEWYLSKSPYPIQEPRWTGLNLDLLKITCKPSDECVFVLQTAVEEDLSEEELRIIERGGGRLCSSHHRPQASTVSSATSSAASVATSAGSTTALIRSKRPRPLWRMGPGEQRERNILITAPKLPEIMPKSKEQEMTPFVEPHVEFQNSTVITVEDPQNNSYITQVGLPPLNPFHLSDMQ